jgi:hypothetical protein
VAEGRLDIEMPKDLLGLKDEVGDHAKALDGMTHRLGEAPASTPP